MVSHKTSWTSCVEQLPWWTEINWHHSWLRSETNWRRYYLTCNCTLAHLWHPAKVRCINVVNNKTTWSNDDNYASENNSIRYWWEHLHETNYHTVNSPTWLAWQTTLWAECRSAGTRWWQQIQTADELCPATLTDQYSPVNGTRRTRNMCSCIDMQSHASSSSTFHQQHATTPAIY